ncbi:MAG: hypothetical protein IPL65_12400 [Lewinellaceae bacterium]|nr:hypothetical protein [Lewinellaceae bacterium]
MKSNLSFIGALLLLLVLLSSSKCNTGDSPGDQQILAEGALIDISCFSTMNKQFHVTSSNGFDAYTDRLGSIKKVFVQKGSSVQVLDDSIEMQELTFIELGVLESVSFSFDKSLNSGDTSKIKGSVVFESSGNDVYVVTVTEEAGQQRSEEIRCKGDGTFEKGDIELTFPITFEVLKKPSTGSVESKGKIKIKNAGAENKVDIKLNQTKKKWVLQ